MCFFFFFSFFFSALTEDKIPRLRSRNFSIAFSRFSLSVSFVVKEHHHEIDTEFLFCSSVLFSSSSSSSSLAYRTFGSECLGTTRPKSSSSSSSSPSFSSPAKAFKFTSHALFLPTVVFALLFLLQGKNSSVFLSFSSLRSFTFFKTLSFSSRAHLTLFCENSSLRRLVSAAKRVKSLFFLFFISLVFFFSSPSSSFDEKELLCRLLLPSCDDMRVILFFLTEKKNV